VQIGLNDLKTVYFNINDKDRSGHPAAMEENELWKDGKKSWKTMENISINLYCIDFFHYNKKKCEKLARTFAPI